MTEINPDEEPRMFVLSDGRTVDELTMIDHAIPHIERKIAVLRAQISELRERRRKLTRRRRTLASSCANTRPNGAS